MQGPKEPKVYTNLALAHTKLGHFQEAFDAFEQAGPSAAAYNNLGVAHLEVRDFKRAASCFEKAITAHPTFYEKANDNLRKAQAGLAANHVIGDAGKEACL